jgi:hypothetical protein
MCLTNRLRGLKGRAAPAATCLSPVARDYPSRALGDFFQAAALRLFYQGTGRGCGVFSKNEGFVLHNFFTVETGE